MTIPITQLDGGTHAPLRSAVRALVIWALCLLAVIAWTAVEVPT